MTTITGSSPTLLTLPPEIRDQIWEYTLEDPFYDPDTSNDLCPSASSPTTAIVQPREIHHCETIDLYWGLEPMTRLLRVNRQIHDEATQVLYERFTFELSAIDDTCQAIKGFFATISARQKKFIRTVTIRLAVWHCSRSMFLNEAVYQVRFGQLKTALVNLQKIKFELVVLQRHRGQRNEGLEDQLDRDVWKPNPWHVTSIFQGGPKVEVELAPSGRYWPREKRILEGWCDRLQSSANDTAAEG